jgi:double-strand break repair protein MRE11
MENDEIRGEDSFITFEEILKIGVEQKVDMILLGGDLFDENKPSKETVIKTIELFRKYCTGSKSIDLKIHSDGKVNFKNSFGTVNYEDPNFNISLPVFCIQYFKL